MFHCVSVSPLQSGYGINKEGHLHELTRRCLWAKSYVDTRSQLRNEANIHNLTFSNPRVSICVCCKGLKGPIINRDEP